MTSKVQSTTFKNSDTNKGFSFAAEVRAYGEAFRRYWPLSISIGFLFAWLLSFPLQGPLFSALVQKFGVEPFPVTEAFLIGHLTGLLGAGLFGVYFRRYLVWLSLAGIPCLALSLISVNSSSVPWVPVFALMGLFAGFAVISWGTVFSSVVVPELRGRTFVIGAVLANLFMYLFVNLVRLSVNLNLMIDLVGLAPLAVPLILIVFYRSSGAAVGRAAFVDNVPQSPVKPWLFLPFIFVVYLVAGLLYFVEYYLYQPSTELIALYGLIPYIILLVLAGTLSDVFGRRVNAVIGAVGIGIGFMLIGLLKGGLQFVAVQTLLVGGYAFVDAFTWVIVADLAVHRRAPLIYGAMLGTNILAILAGTVIGEIFGPPAVGQEIIFVSVAGVFSLLALGLMFTLKETLPHKILPSSVVQFDSLESFSEKAGLTSRELEIARMLVDGSSTQEILNKLVITDNTLKTHLRNIFRKAGARNRLEFILAFMKDSNEKS